jgi:hypothetical protein
VDVNVVVDRVAGWQAVTFPVARATFILYQAINIEEAIPVDFLMANGGEIVTCQNYF